MLLFSNCTLLDLSSLRLLNTNARHNPSLIELLEKTKNFLSLRFALLNIIIRHWPLVWSSSSFPRSNFFVIVKDIIFCKYGGFFLIHFLVVQDCKMSYLWLLFIFKSFITHSLSTNLWKRCSSILPFSTFFLALLRLEIINILITWFGWYLWDRSLILLVDQGILWVLLDASEKIRVIGRGTRIVRIGHIEFLVMFPILILIIFTWTDRKSEDWLLYRVYSTNYWCVETTIVP